MAAKSKKDYFSEKQQYYILEGELRVERESFKRYWRDLSDFILPRRSKFFISDVNRGDRRNNKILNSTATLAVRTLSSGMMTGVTSPARPWFKLSTDDDELNSNENVKFYMKLVAEKMRFIFLKSNLYNVLPTLYGDMGVFGTGCIFMEEDNEDVVRFTSFPLGSYMISNDEKGRVRTFFREFQMTVRQIVEKFGRQPNNEISWDNISSQVKDLWDNGNKEQYIDIAHCVKKNRDYKIDSLEAKYKEFSSVYYEKGIGGSKVSGGSALEDDKFLRKSGYDFFPVMCPRWEVAGEDTYGTNSPGMVCLGDVKQLQAQEKDKAQAIAQKARPAMVGPTNLKNKKASILPGDITYIDEREGSQSFRRLFEVDFDIRELQFDKQELERRISRAFYEDLFLMMAQSDRRQITATEVDERREEKLLALGPVLERINQDLLDPLIQNTFKLMVESGELPEAPEELRDSEYKIEYISIMAQAQKLAGITNIERLVGYVGNVAGIDPSIVQKIDIEESVEIYANLLGVDPSLIRTKEFMEKQRQAAQLAQQREQEAQLTAQAIESGKTLSETNVDEGSALSQILG